MLYAIIGKPGEGKTQFAVSKHFEFDLTNQKNAVKNVKTYFDNKEILTVRELNEPFKAFEVFEDEEQFEDYFETHLEYNLLIQKVNEEHNLKLSNLLPVRQIYSDIAGLKKDIFPNIKQSPDDWRTAPKGSIIFYDEIQEREAYEFKGNKYSQDPMIKELSKIRHGDRDIWAITQDANRLEKSLHKLIDRMYFVKRPDAKPKCASIYVFDQWLSNPRAAADSQQELKKYREHFIFNYKQKYFNAYTSASSHSSMGFRLNKKIILILLAILTLGCIAIYGFGHVSIFSSFTDAFKQMTGQSTSDALSDLSKVPTDKSETPTLDKDTNQENADSSLVKDLNVECRKGTNIDKPECVKWFNDLSKNNGSAMGSERNYSVSYNPNKPFDDEEIINNLSYQVTAKPVFSGCMKKGSHYVAYTQQGTILKGVSQSDCQRLVDQNDRPFDYFKEQKNALVNQNDNSQVNQQTNQQIL